ncbi:elastase-1-like [Bufo gargarizans]|uniref:elastase-1-like n=1 Tax=Bufo gargarizans TaxID=30331 RepID=UPI001CF1791A|nr:elastase-1-like [Bufo gargarizans]
MLRLLVLAALVILGQCNNEGISYFEQLPSGRVVGGYNAAKNAWPWQVSIQYLSGGYWYHNCGGTLIRANRVLTAAHCMDTPGTYRVDLGEYNLASYEGSEQFIAVSSYRKHSLWNPSNIANGYDIAILWLASSATLNSAVKLATLPTSGYTLPSNYNCIVTGWGRVSTTGPFPAILQQVNLPVVAYPTCSLGSWWGTTVKPSMICAGGDGVKSVCFGDSGGPLSCVVNGVYQVHGIVSFVSSLGCNYYRKPSVFTKVSDYISWINSVSNVYDCLF